MRRIVLLMASMALAVIFGSGVALADTPTTKADCKNGGYAKYGFKSQRECIKAVKNAPPADTTPPVLTQVAGPAEGELYAGGQMYFESNEPVTFTYDMCKVGGVAPCPSYKEYGTGSDTRFELNWSTDNVRGDTPMVFYLKATDAAGNTTTVERRWTQEDIKPPEITVTGPEGVTSSTRAAYNLEANEPVTWECSFVLTPAGATEPNTEVDTGCYGGPMSWDINTDGKYVFTFKAKDAAGNTSTVTKTLVLDRVKPTVSITSGPGEGATVDTNSVSFGWKAEDNLEVKNVRCFLEVAGTGEMIPVDGAAAGDFQCGGTSYTGESRNPATFSNLEEGQYSFIVVAYDSAGQWEIAARHNFKISVPSPPVASSELGNSGGSTTLVYSGSGTGQIGQPVQSFRVAQDTTLDSLSAHVCVDSPEETLTRVAVRITLYRRIDAGSMEAITAPRDVEWESSGLCNEGSPRIEYSDYNIQLEAGREYGIGIISNRDAPFPSPQTKWFWGTAYEGGAQYENPSYFRMGIPTTYPDLAFAVYGE